jgi:hypothetical protein
MPRTDRHIGATISRYKAGRELQRRGQRAPGEAPRAHQCHWRRGLDNIGYHGRIDGD